MKTISVSAGAIHYDWYCVDDLKAKNNTTLEAYLVFTRGTTMLKPQISFYHDCMNGTGISTQLAISKEFPVSDSGAVEMTSALRYNRKQWIGNSGFSDPIVMLSMQIESGKFTFIPILGVSWVLFGRRESRQKKRILVWTRTGILKCFQ